MRKLILSIFALLLLAGSGFAYNAPSYDEWTNLTKNNSKQGNPVRELKLVRYGSREPSVDTISAGSAVVYDMVSDDGVTIDVTTVSADGGFAGIAATTIPSADSGATTANGAVDDAGRRNWGWIVVHGPATAFTFPGGTNGNAAGAKFYTSTDAGGVMALQQNGTSAVNGAALLSSRNSGGFFMDAADGTSTSVDVFVQAE